MTAQFVAPAAAPLTVSALVARIKEALLDAFPAPVSVVGQISNFKRHSSGHLYFSLKDASASIDAVMFRPDARGVRFDVEDGLEVVATGRVDVYERQGRLQLYVRRLIPKGTGALELAFRQLKERLQKEGLFEKRHKKPIPTYPRAIGVVTSPTGAAIRDISNTLRRRWPAVRVYLVPVRVQGEGAAEEIAEAIGLLDAAAEGFAIDTILLARGGGSLEDLWAFNEEVLARAIFNSKIPVISAVGHEVDVTVADFVADARASTPTKAGVVAVPDMQEVLGQLVGIERRLTGQTKARVKLAQQNLEIILANAIFRNPLLLVQNAQQQLDELATRLSSAIRGVLDEAQRRLSAAYEQIVRIEPHRLLKNKTVELNNWQNRVNNVVRKIMTDCRMRLTAQANRLAGLNPKSVLQRGYSITTSKKTGLLVKTLEDVRIGDHLITELADENLIESKVTKK